jgi:hypothetical protein
VVDGRREEYLLGEGTDGVEEAGRGREGDADGERCCWIEEGFATGRGAGIEVVPPLVWTG